MTDSDTLAACIAGGELRANQWGDSALFTPDGGSVRMYENTVRWELACLRCGGRRRVLAYVKGAGGVSAILEHLRAALG